MVTPKILDGYIRVSTEEQASDGVSLRAQRARIEGYADLYGNDEKTPFRLGRIIEDAGASAKTLDRPGIQEALARMRRGESDGLVVAKLDRLTRSLDDWCELIGTYFGEKGGRELISVDNRVDTLTANGRFMLAIIILIAQWERETISERTVAGLREKIRAGERCGKLRYGYDLDPAGPVNRRGRPARLVENEREQAAIRLMREWEAQGRTLREMAQLLEGLGIETKEGRLIWAPKTIARILGRTA